ncbi:hypothetical protein DERP_011230 [Dermatophagoides pteronyssinus]|uniref:Uncharacterized protein n=1 Tax=Dermatophagoides pteronyssinus TaxID=6956 RepID=A0ABQ8JCN1_DERPT|nr:hypothetical protein DERP_011230 [Dermatophagoides pteronyssinus]
MLLVSVVNNEEIAKILARITDRLDIIEIRRNIPNQNVTNKGHDSFVLNQVTKHNGTNIK